VVVVDVALVVDTAAGVVVVMGAVVGTLVVTGAVVIVMGAVVGTLVVTGAGVFVMGTVGAVVVVTGAVGADVVVMGVVVVSALVAAVVVIRILAGRVFGFFDHLREGFSTTEPATYVWGRRGHVFGIGCTRTLEGSDSDAALHEHTLGSFFLISSGVKKKREGELLTFSYRRDRGRPRRCPQQP
jgi:hypothetical protein